MIAALAIELRLSPGELTELDATMLATLADVLDERARMIARARR